ncbi:DUF4340 domain-containing protein [Bowmanella yangjiangensis]|uniref:DUF4340 domain-containing protein n=1 Tax=Bowmanella yangjiangensis TaxID=2811230 RepID=A0ABS3D0P0_9ALTE|nr:DUF4340 domain-containing protein [Bowmanella yangjiangensis]MBN7821454.1 DUF4340 domain-containing protein [Bowmanella yangjiangensis]
MAKHLLSLFLVLLLGTGAGWFLFLQDSQPDVLKQGPLLPELAEQGSKIQRLAMLDAQGLSIEAEQVDGKWLISSEGGYPADEQKLAELLQALVDAKRLQAKTRQVNQFHRLGLQALDAPGSTVSQLTLETDDRSWQLLVGNTPASGHGRYVRFANDNQSWLIDQDLTLPMAVRDWMRQPILNLDKQQIASISRLDGKGWRISRESAEQTDFVLNKLPSGRELKYASVLDSLLANVLNLNFEERLVVGEEFWQAPLQASMQLVTFDGQQVDLSLLESEEKHYVRFTSQSSAPYWQGETYLISGFSANQLDKQVEDFLAEPPAPENKLPVGHVEEGEAPHR